MRKPSVLAVGGVPSADIAVPDHDRELAFYSHVLTTGDAPCWRDDLANSLGTPIIGLGVRVPEYEALPLQWTPHFQVADVATSVAHAVELGGRVVMQDDQNQWAVLTDPVGAALGLIPVVDDAVEGDASDTPQAGQVGCIAWLSLTVPDAAASRDFYQRVIGWSSVPMDTVGDGVAFEMQVDSQTAAAEIRQVRDDPPPIPSVWLIHLPVGDLHESLRRVSEKGGEVIQTPGDSQPAIVRDPVGVYLALQAGASRVP